MDNRLTKRRLSDFLAYEWILMIVVALVAIIILELAYTVAATRLSTGQQFKYYMDEDIYSFDAADKSIYDLLGVETGKNGKTFSYDVLSVDFENLNSSYNVLSVRLSIQEGDAIFTSSVEEEGKSVRVKNVIDEFSVYDMQSLLISAQEYLTKFVKVGGDIYNPDDYDENKIRNHFDARMKGDKRFKQESEKEEGRQNEIGRIKKLADEVKDFEYVLSIGEEKGLFYRYTKYAQSYNANPDNETSKKLYEKEVAEGRENLVYGFNMAKLTGGERNVADYLTISGTGSAQNVVLVLFDFADYQPDLQYEGISFFNTLVREFSDIL